jgi:hypothetical protein
MKAYAVTIMAKGFETMVVEADSAKEAAQKAQQKWCAKPPPYMVPVAGIAYMTRPIDPVCPAYVDVFDVEVSDSPPPKQSKGK